MNKSNQSKIIEKILKITGRKKRFESLESAKKLLVKRRKKNQKKYKIPKMYRNIASPKNFNGTPYFKFTGEEKVVLYLHGGAFIYRPLIFHWDFLDDIISKTEATVYMPLYPLAPEFSHKETYKFLMKFYKFLLNNHKPENITIMGDSAGGTLSLGLVHLFKKKNIPLPAKVITLAPCLDITFANPKIAEVESKDPMLSRVGCAYVCQYWARGAKLTAPEISPKFIDITDFPPVFIFVGTHDILHPDIKEFTQKHKAKSFDISTQDDKFEAINLFEVEGMNHVYPLFPIPEARQAEDIIARIILK